MNLIDSTLLLHAYRKEAPEHELAAAWLEWTMGGAAPVGLAWAGILAFIRISTNPRVYRDPLETSEAMRITTEWLARPNVTILQPTDRHWEALAGLLERTGARANLVTDAHLAALAIEHGATLCSTDTDFARFPGLRWENPIAPT